MAQAPLAQARVAQEIGSIGKFIVECLERKPGSSETLGVICLSYQQWCQKRQAVVVPAFRERFLKMVRRLIPESDIYSDRYLQATVVWNVRLKDPAMTITELSEDNA
jgi:hypothetical protein